MVNFIDKVKGKLTRMSHADKTPSASTPRKKDTRDSGNQAKPQAEKKSTPPSKAQRESGQEPRPRAEKESESSERPPRRRRRSGQRKTEPRENAQPEGDRPRAASVKADKDEKTEREGTTRGRRRGPRKADPREGAKPEDDRPRTAPAKAEQGEQTERDGERGQRRGSRGRGRGRSRPRSEEGGRPDRDKPEPRKAAPVSDWNPEKYHVEPKDGEIRFHDLDLNPELMHAVYDLGFKYCTPIQAGILPAMVKGSDAIGKAQTGTGKTAAFLLCMFNHFINKPREDAQPGCPRALVLAPTRELVIQIEKEAREIGKYTNFRSLAVYGGIDYKKQLNTLKEGAIDLLVATPGRLLDFRRSQDVHLSHVEILVIDEADRMLDMGFIPDVRNIVHSTPHKDKRQTLFFSATFNNDVIRLANQWTRSPVQVEIEPEQVAAENVRQVVYLATKKEKLPIVYNILKEEGTDRVLIFSNWREEARRLEETLHDYGFNCALLSGAVDQSKRQRTLEAFKAGKIQIIVATDVAGRGIHVEGLSHVINYDLPHDPEDYVHRIGRTGRAGASGTSISFATEDDAFMLPDIEQFLGDSLKCIYPGEELLQIPPRPRRAHPERSEHAHSDRRPPRSGNRSRGGSGGRQGRSHPRGSKRS